ncbi:nucleotidyl transferase AbiEii/AbiGii toxin family protein [Candidatus Uhrbacteria bacterium]|nr:nucleotidyl transferase AbiEii/AbiGii toxin family protein [Candidatus Uhrbacteria bacterium]
MTIHELEQHVRSLGIAKDHILREEAEMLFLRDLATDTLGAKVLFYGGTALRLAYGSPRFSEDIDLLRIKRFSFKDFSAFMKRAVRRHQGWKLTDAKEKRNTLFAFILISDDKLKHNFSIKIEIHKPTKPVCLTSQLAILRSPVSVEEPLLLVPTLVELKRLKEDALEKRKKARDIFDLWYIAQSMREQFATQLTLAPYTRRMFKNELQVFLPRHFYPVIDQLYDTITKKN